MRISILASTLALLASSALASPTPAGAGQGVDARDWKGCPGNINVCINSCREQGLGNNGECRGFLLHECHCLP